MVFKISGMQNAVEFIYLVSKKAVKSKYLMQNMFSEKLLKNYIKP